MDMLPKFHLLLFRAIQVFYLYYPLSFQILLQIFAEELPWVLA